MTRRLTTVLLAALAIGGGCAARQQPVNPDDDYSPFRERGRGGSTVIENAPALLQAGPLPMAYMVGAAGGTIRIVDATTQRTLLSTTVLPGQPIAISPEGGIVIGSDQLLPGPLPLNHRYELWWDAERP